jgi:hypothetical protein
MGLPPKQRLTAAALGMGMAVPLLYYGVQAAAAPFYPDFSILTTTASELGSDRSTLPSTFNVGVILVAVATLVASFGFLRALRRLGVNPILAWLTFLSIAANGMSSLWAGLFPLPDPRHGGHPVFMIGMLLLPFLLAAAFWKLSDARLLKAYFIATILLLVAMIPIISGMSGLDTQSYRGLFQRIFALTVFPPIGVGAYVLAKRRKSGPENSLAGAA